MNGRNSILKLKTAIIFFISGYIPLFLILIIKDLENINISNFKIGIPIFKNPILDYILLGIILSSSVLHIIVMKHLQSDGFPITINKARSKSSEIVNYTIPYMISFFAFDLSKITDIIVFAIFFIMLCLLSIFSQSIFINPLMSLWGYGLYECDFEENGIKKEKIIISKVDLIPDKKYEIKRLTNYIVIITKYPEE